MQIKQSLCCVTHNHNIFEMKYDIVNDFSMTVVQDCQQYSLYLYIIKSGRGGVLISSFTKTDPKLTHMDSSMTLM